MKQEVSKYKASRLINCGMVALVSCAYKDKQDVTACGWHMPVSKEPPALAVALYNKHFSTELIRKSQEFVVNICDWSLREKVIFCGSHSGRDIDKFKGAGLTPQRAHSLIKTPVVGESIASVECLLFDIKETGDHFLFFGEVVYAQADSDYFISGVWDTNKIELILHLGSNVFFKSSPFVEFK